MDIVIHTNVDERKLVVDDELRKAVADARDREHAIESLLDAKSRRENETALRTHLSCGIEQVEIWARQNDLPIDEFVSRCINLRGPLDEGLKRKRMRELARLYLLLSSETEIPTQPSEHRHLWETLQSDEPYLYLPHKTSNYRTSYIPFTFYLESVDCLDPGLATVSAEDIEREIAALLAFLRREDAACELRAACAYYLHGRIHPFHDGNGHVGRALACLTLGKDYSTWTKLTFVQAIHSNRGKVEEVFKCVTAGHDDLRSAVTFILSLLAQAQQETLETKIAT